MIDRIRKAQDEDSGFTLIELLVVVIIIGILAAIAIPVFLNQRESAWRSSVESDLRNASTAMETYFTQNSVYPSAIGDTEFQNSDDVTVAITSGAGGTSAYCLSGAHTNLNSGSPILWYDSDGGGLVDSAC